MEGWFTLNHKIMKDSYLYSSEILTFARSPAFLEPSAWPDDRHTPDYTLLISGKLPSVPPPYMNQSFYI